MIDDITPDLMEPWSALDREGADQMEAELRRELAVDHPLASVTATAF